MANIINCGVTVGNTGLQHCSENFGYDEKLIITPKNFEFTNITDAELLTNWVGEFFKEKTSRSFPLPSFFILEPDVEDSVYEDGIAGEREFVREGKVRLKGTMPLISLHNHKALRKFNNQSGLAAFIVTSNGYIKGWSSDGTNFKPFSVSEFNINKQTVSDGTKLARTELYISFANPIEWNDKGSYVKSETFDPIAEFIGVKDVKLTVGATTSTTKIDITITDVNSSFGYNGFVVGDFLLKDAAGAEVPITDITDNLNGSYSLTGTFAAGAATLTLQDITNMTTKGFEAYNTLSLTIA